MVQEYSNQGLVSPQGRVGDALFWEHGIVAKGRHRIFPKGFNTCPLLMLTRPDLESTLPLSYPMFAFGWVEIRPVDKKVQMGKCVGYCQRESPAIATFARHRLYNLQNPWHCRHR